MQEKQCQKIQFKKRKMEKWTCNTLNILQFFNVCSFFSFSNAKVNTVFFFLFFCLAKACLSFFSFFFFLINIFLTSLNIIHFLSLTFFSIFLFVLCFVNYFLSLFFLSISHFIYSFRRNPLRIRKIVRICESVKLFIQKSLWFFQRIFTISIRIRLRSRILWSLTAFAISEFLVVSCDSEVTFLGEEKDANFCPFVYWTLFIDCLA